MINKTVLLTCFGFLACEARELSQVPSSRIPPVESSSRTDPGQEEQSIHAAFDGLLREHLSGERVDYLRLRDEGWPKLESYLQGLARVDMSELSQSAKLALYINLYNATLIKEVCLNLKAGFSSAENEFALFNAQIVYQGGEKFSLNHLENEIIRKQFEEPRIHVALVCGARSCPPLIGQAYTAENLEGLLAANMKRFVNDTFRNKVTEERLSLSKIFEWYADDFGGMDRLREFIAAYTEVDITKSKIDFLEYYWELNLAEPSLGKWVQVEEAGGGLAKGDMVEVLGKENGDLILRLPFNKGETRLAADQVKALADS